MWGSGGSGLFKGLIAALCIISTISLALVYFIPSPPSKVVMATAFKGASFEYYGRQYREVFARYHVDLELRETAGAVENVKLLQSEVRRSNCIYNRRRPDQSECPLWLKSRHLQRTSRCPLRAKSGGCVSSIAQQ